MSGHTLAGACTWRLRRTGISNDRGTEKETMPKQAIGKQNVMKRKPRNNEGSAGIWNHVAEGEQTDSTYEGRCRVETTHKRNASWAGQGPAK
ncbi:hypothetical protein R1flu_020254 [Riccia fluitans]|uniref:Uncharacterized protein n=1 Tax=Riccia fluitans TaxID=41844 RepID=A0ABD1ZKZ4_9MARC